MRVRVRHELVHTLRKGTRTAIATIRVTPRNHEGQYVQRWSLDVQPDTRLHPHEDAFGNLTHTFSVDSPGAEIALVAAGEVDTQDTSGIVRGTVERFPPTLFLRPTHNTAVTPEVAAFARLVLDASTDELGRLHALMSIIHAEVKEDPRLVGTLAASAADALKDKAACAGGLTHLFIACAQHLGIPARHVGGYVADETGEGVAREWGEAYVPRIGWIAFDCGRSVCATERYVRVAAGLDSTGVEMLKGIGETTRQDVRAQEVRMAGKHRPSHPRASQSQRQQ